MVAVDQFVSPVDFVKKRVQKKKKKIKMTDSYVYDRIQILDIIVVGHAVLAI